MKTIIRIAYLYCVMFVASQALAAEPIKVLMVGNSYTYFWGMPEIIKRLGRADGEKIDITLELEGGATLEDFWKKGRFKKDLSKGPFDVAILQKWERRTQKEDLSKYLPLMADELRKQNPKIKIFVYMTESGAVQVSDGKSKHGSHLEKFEEISKTRLKKIQATYAKAADKTKITVIPCTLAWQNATKEKPPALQWYSGPKDGHPSPKRQYLTACMMFSAITGKSPIGNKYNLIGIMQNPVKAKWIKAKDDKYVFSKWGVDWITLKPKKGRIKEVKLSDLTKDDLKIVKSKKEQNTLRTWQIPGDPFLFTKTVRKGTPEEINYMQNLAWKSLSKK